MPRRRDKATDTEQSDSYELKHPLERQATFGIQINRYQPPDELPETDPKKYSVRSWANVLQVHRLVQWPERKDLFERAVKCLPYSYKIWHNYLSEYIDFCSNRCVMSRDYAELNKLFERCLQYLPKMPRIWMMYADCLAKQNLISKARFVYNWSFKNLPLTQHEKIWAKYAPWVLSLENSKTAIQVIPRYLQLNPDYKQVYAAYLKQRKEHNLCAKVLNDILLDEGYNSKQGKSKYDFFMELVDVIIEEPVIITSVNGQNLLREGILKYQEEVGSLWVKLSDYFIRLGQFQKARQTLETALNSIDTAKDFGLVFNAYCKFEQEMINALANKEVREKQGILPEDLMDAEVQLRLQKLQKLLNRRPYLLYNINLRKNPNDVKTWLKLIDLYKQSGDTDECFATIDRCTKTIKSDEAENGRYSEIWIYAAKLHQQLHNLRMCNEIFFQSTQVNYKTIEDYISVWTRWAEVMIQEGYPKDALAIIKHVLFRRKIDADNLKIKNIDEVLKSSALIWQLYIDIQLQVGTFETSKMAYNRCKEHKSLTPLMLLNYVNMLWDNAYFEEVFRVFEFAVGHFKWPNVYEIWLSYISRFIERYGTDGIGVERTRSIFERLLKQVPQDKCRIFYFMYAQFEEEYGLYSHAVEILDRMVNAVKNEQKYDCYSIYIAKVANLLGITKTRAIFEAALKKLSEDEIILMAIKYAQLQKNMGEIERARGVYVYASQFTDPRDDSDKLWAEWQNFQVQFGSKQTYKEYLRIKRSVTAKFSMLPPDIKKLQDKINRGLV